MKIRIKNFRSFKDTGLIDIKPITILVGNNSSGKSSFLRTFPMLKQSVEERTRTPILLYGNYVDFGSAKDIKPHFNHGTDCEYELGFTFSKNIFTDINRMRNRNRHIGYYRRSMYGPNDTFDIDFNVNFEEDKKGLLHVKELGFLLNGNEISIQLNYSKKLIECIKVNQQILISDEDNIKFIDRGDFAFDYFQADKKLENLLSRRAGLVYYLEEKIIRLLTKHVHGRTEDDTKWDIVNGMKISTSQEMLNNLQKHYLPSWQDNIKTWDIDNKDFNDLKNLLVLYELLNSFMYSINNYFKNTFSNVKYIAPLRATAERYYRIQHLAVDDIDPNGKNLPFFLESLTETQTEDFQSWTKDNFDFIVKISKPEGHYSIKIVHDNAQEINLSDMGFGYSQILPILTQLWYSASRYDNKSRRMGSKNTEKIIVIEQPELHLHPEFQAKFADIMVKVINHAKENNIYLKLIIETHSDIIINRLGDNILTKEIDAEEINIVIFNKKSETSPSTINLSYYDNDGNLLKWPLGFFLPKVKI